MPGTRIFTERLIAVAFRAGLGGLPGPIRTNVGRIYIESRLQLRLMFKAVKYLQIPGWHGAC
jgi:hypothetical protein